VVVGGGAWIQSQFVDQGIRRPRLTKLLPVTPNFDVTAEVQDHASQAPLAARRLRDLRGLHSAEELPVKAFHRPPTGCDIGCTLSICCIPLPLWCFRTSERPGRIVSILVAGVHTPFGTQAR
jgi:hypothetical protein